ncbi:MAG: CDP-alcohol phosphatidyltransferase family protein [Phycisphaeraceae bacterium]|nr:CDP-alcohol phosphatidyltransferase family protein [Phycisphaeraceae bacterium]
MRRHLPNQLTMLRLALAAVFFVVLNQYRYPRASEAVLWTSIVLFVIAALTDIADGYLARKWKVESTFGRIMDPFVDKVLVIGAFIYLSGPRFVDPASVERGELFTMVSGVYPWMVAIILARELLVTGVRGELEGRGIRFGAKLGGKLKTLLQSIAIPFVLGIVALDPNVPGHAWMQWVRDGLVYASVLATVISGIPYITGAAAAIGLEKSQGHSS